MIRRPDLDVSLIAIRFKADVPAIAGLVADDEEFRSLCEDYLLAVETLRRLETPHRLEAHAKMVEYQRIVSELEDEIFKALAEKKIGANR